MTAKEQNKFLIFKKKTTTSKNKIREHLIEAVKDLDGVDISPAAFIKQMAKMLGVCHRTLQKFYDGENISYSSLQKITKRYEDWNGVDEYKNELTKMSTKKIVKRYRDRFLNERNRNIINSWNDDSTWTHQSLGKEFGVSRERIRQILKEAQLHGISTRPSTERSKNLNLERIEAVKAEVFYALENIYGTSEYPAWKKQFLKKALVIQRKFLREELRRRWKNGTLDPLLNFYTDASLKERHYKILQYRKLGMTWKEIGKTLNLSKASIAIYLKDLKLAGLYPNSRQKQVEAVSLDNDLVQERLDKIREALISGKSIREIKVVGYMGDAAQFVRKHFTKPYYHEQNKKNQEAE